MTITRTQKYANSVAAGTTATARSGNLGSLSYTAGNLVVVALLTSAEQDGSFSVTASGWTFTQRSSYQFDGNGNSWAQVAIFTATVPSTGNHTINVSTNSVLAYQLHAIAWEMSSDSGVCLPAAVGNAGAQASVNGAQSITLDSSPASGSYVLQATHVDCDPGAATVTPGSGWTEDADFVSGASNYGNSHSQYRTGSTSATCTVDDLQANGSIANLSWAMAAIEVEEGALPAPDAPTLLRTGEVRDGTVPLTWTNPAGTLTGRVVEYAAEAYRGASLSWSTFENSSTATAGVDVTGLTNGTRYVFRVAMKNATGTGTSALSETGATPVKRPFVVGVGTITAVTTGSTTPAYPAGYTAVAGDVALIIGAGRPSGTTEIATPSGYAVVATVLREVGTNDLRLQAFSKTLTTSEAMPSITTPTGWTGTSAGMSLRVVILRDVDAVDVAAVTSDSAAAATFRPTGLTTLTADALVITVAATADDNTLIFDTTTAPSSHQNFTLADAQATTTGGDHAVAISHRWGAVPAISTQASTADPLTAAFQKATAPTDTGNFQYLRTGSGGTVFVLDSGCRTSHDEFTGRVVDTWVPTGSGWSASTDSVTSPGHGTAVASIAAGDTLGIARAADIVIMKVHNSTDQGATPTAAHFTEALEYIVANFDAPYFVNWSLAGPVETDASEFAAYEAAIDDFTAAGGVIIVAGGNSGSDWPDQYMPDDHPATYKVMGHTFAGAKDSSSSQATDQALSAMYGSHTTASNAGDATTTTGNSGTSFAAPIVAGTAVAVSAANTSLTAAQVMDLVINGATEGLTGFPAGYSTRKLYSNVDVPGLVGAVTPPLLRQSTAGSDAWAAFTVAFKPASAVSASATPSTVATTVSVPAPSVSATSNVSVAASVVALAVAVLAPSVSATSDATTTPAAVTATVAIPAPSVSATSNATVSASTVALLAAIPSPTVSATATVSPSVVAAACSVPAPSVSTAANATATPDTVAATVAIPAPSVSAASNATATPSTVATTVTVPSPAVQAGGSSFVSAPTVSATITIPAPSVTATASATASPSTVSTTVGVPTPSIATAAGATAAPTTVATTTTIPAPSITATSTATAAPSTVAATVAIPSPTVAVTSSATATPSAVAVTVTIPAPALSVGVPTVTGRLTTTDNSIARTTGDESIERTTSDASTQRTTLEVFG